MKAKICIVLYSYHHNNTEKIAAAISEILEAPIKSPDGIDPEELAAYDCIGFGSGIYSDKHHLSLLKLTESLPPAEEKKAFLFSTCGAPAFAVDGGQLADYIVKAHAELKKKLLVKGYLHLGDFMCPGWNTNSFLKLFGGINKGRPNRKDLENARDFAEVIKKQL
jgi:flavodoxin